MITTYVIIGIIIIILIVLGTWERSRFKIYWKSESHTALVRTGLGGSKAFVGGGAFVIPLLHKIQWVDLSETRFFVKREKDNSIITKNLLRADIEMEVYIRVKDQNILANRVLINAWKRKARPEGTYVNYSDKEKLLLGYLEDNDSITLSKFRKIAKLSAYKAENILTNFLALDIIEIEISEKQVHYTLSKSFEAI